MGMNKNDPADELEKLIEGDGIEEEASGTEGDKPSETPEKKAADENGNTPEPKKEQPKAKAMLQTEEQVELTREIAKIDAKIDALKGKTVDTDDFYANLDDHLSEEEAQLEFNDKPAYMKLVNEKLADFTKQHSKSDEIETLEKEKGDLEQIYKRQEGIVAVSGKYADYDHEKVQSFFLNDLSKSEQEKILSASSSYADVYENAYKKYQEANPSAVASQKAPAIPNVSTARKQPLEPSEADTVMTDEDEQLRDALGL
jgi:hypothetical protein